MIWFLYLENVGLTSACDFNVFWKRVQVYSQKLPASNGAIKSLTVRAGPSSALLWNWWGPDGSFKADSRGWRTAISEDETSHLKIAYRCKSKVNWMQMAHKKHGPARPPWDWWTVEFVTDVIPFVARSTDEPRGSVPPPNGPLLWIMTAAVPMWPLAKCVYLSVYLILIFSLQSVCPCVSVWLRWTDSPLSGRWDERTLMGHSGCRGRGQHKRRHVPPTTSIPPSGGSATSFTKPIPQWDEIDVCGCRGFLGNQPSRPSYDNCCRLFPFLILMLSWN